MTASVVIGADLLVDVGMPAENQHVTDTCFCCSVLFHYESVNQNTEKISENLAECVENAEPRQTTDTWEPTDVEVMVATDKVFQSSREYIPTCCICAKKIGEEIDRRVTILEAEHKEMLEELRKIEDGSNEKHAKNSCLQAELTALKNEQAELTVKLDALDKELNTVDAYQKQVNEQAKQYKQKEEDGICALRDLTRESLGLSDLNQSLTARRDYNETAMRSLNDIELYSLVFDIKTNGRVGMVNGLNLGRLNQGYITWKECNAALASAVHLLKVIITRIDVDIHPFKCDPLGLPYITYIKDDGSEEELPLFGPNKSQRPNFDQGLIAFHECLKRTTTFLSETHNIRIPYSMKTNGIVEDSMKAYSVNFTLNTDENWTTAMRYMLANMKCVLVLRLTEWTFTMEDEMQRAVGDVLKRVLMVPPTHFTVEYSINPWMGGVVDKNKAHEQWNELKVAIEKEGVKVETLEQVKGLPDMVFVCNSGIVHGNKVYLSRFQHKERTGEQEHYLKWFEKEGFEIHGRDYADHFEGGGDACFSTYNTLWAGFGPRSNRSVYDKISKIGAFDSVICELALPQFYHLDTCFCPVSEKAALWYPPAFSVATQEEIKKRLPESIAVSDAEANAFICNAITIRKTVIAPIGVAAETKDRLAKLGYSVTEVDMSEFMKSGGACQCLVLKL